MRTTLSLDDDAMLAIRAYSKQNDVSIGQAASELIRRGARFRLGVRFVNEVPVFDVPEDFPAIRAEAARDLAEER
jgi:hypothetical protein